MWCAGASAATYKSTDGHNWDVATSTGNISTNCAWQAYVSGLYDAGLPALRIFAIQSSDNQIYTYYGTGTAWSGSQNYIPKENAVGQIPLGSLTDGSVVYIASGAYVYEVGHRGITVGAAIPVAVMPAGVSSVECGCRVEDEFALSDGYRIVLWHPTRPTRDISIWGDDGCPPDQEGKVKSLTAVGEFLVAFYEFDGGTSCTFWSRPNLQGQMTWHRRTATLSGGFPLSVGSNIVFAQKTVSDLRRLWVVTADGSNCRTYYQDHPDAGLNPLPDATSKYENGYGYLFTGWHDLVLMGDEALALAEIERNANLTATEVMTVDYRADYENLAELDGSATWKTGLTINNTRRQLDIRAGTGAQALAVQLKIGLDRGGTATTTPVLRDLAVIAKRQVRHPSLGRT